jgi:hypothetical protein
MLSGLKGFKHYEPTIAHRLRKVGISGKYGVFGISDIKESR